MPSCEMCGKSKELVVADIEGVELKVCDVCARFGTIRRKVNIIYPVSRPMQREESSFKVVDNYAALLHAARHKKGLTQEEFAKLLQEKESVVVHWEAGSAKPQIDSARRVGRILGINVIEQDITAAMKIESGKKTEELTLGDFVKVRK